MEAPKKMHEDSNGNKSSKRLWGTILLVLGCVMKTILFAAAIKWKISDPATAMGVSSTIMYTGGGLLGIGVAEYWGRKK